MTGYYREGTERAEHVRRLFTRIARHYDLINDLQSAGLHRFWKSRLISALQPQAGERILDLACGSGDLAFRLARAQPDALLIGGDFTASMLRVALERSRQEPVSVGGWIQLDGLSLPFADASLDAVMMAYGLRNMADPARVLRGIARVLKPGGRVAILDFGKPSNRVIRAVYGALLKTLQPTLGWLFFRDANTYAYIHESLRHYPAQDGVARLLAETGFAGISCQNLALGAMSLHLARK
ncbi:MAG: ubiquinone/menaquinone biosynthesis methyltransferase [Verrucomicrobia bacterium]|nr:ubiquinone/menaquinone biosynthesis methyltransferase [Verrucomicrobiota bacterium]